jgi:geranylgeranyl pyrophosphate synthase
LERSKKIAEELIKSAKKDLRGFGKKRVIFEELADYIVSRVN